MIMKFAGPALAVALSIGAMASVAMAAGAPADLVKERQDEMRTNSDTMKALLGILKGDKPYDAATVKGMSDGIAASFDKMWKDGVWDTSTQSITTENKAKPEIWSDAAGFEKARKDAMDALAALGASTDLAGMKAALPKLGAACKGCHETYRQPEN